MPALLVHGVPDTDRVLARGRSARSGRPDVETLRLPGFGGPTPDGFDPTKDAYAAWLVEQIVAPGRAGRPGRPRLGRAARAPRGVPATGAGAELGRGGRAARRRVRLAQGRPGLADAGGRRAGDGQAHGAGDGKALAAAGVPSEDAREAAAHLDDTMKRCILRLYRSAIHGRRASGAPTSPA